MSGIINGFCSTDSHPDLSIQYRLADDVPKLIYSSHYSLSRIMINLIENAVKFTQKGSILLSNVWISIIVTIKPSYYDAVIQISLLLMIT